MGLTFCGQPARSPFAQLLREAPPVPPGGVKVVKSNAVIGPLKVAAMPWWTDERTRPGPVVVTVKVTSAMMSPPPLLAIAELANRSPKLPAASTAGVMSIAVVFTVLSAGTAKLLKTRLPDWILAPVAIRSDSKVARATGWPAASAARVRTDGRHL